MGVHFLPTRSCVKIIISPKNPEKNAAQNAASPRYGSHGVRA